MFHMGFFNYFYPGLGAKEKRKYSLLSLIFVVIIGNYWLLRLLKNTIFLKVAFPVCFGWGLQQGCLFQPYAKTVSSLGVFIVLLVYSKLVDWLKPHQLFYVFSAIYAALFGVFAALLGIREFYGDVFLGRSALAGLGWVSYSNGKTKWQV